jgi:flagellar protein FlaG
MALDVLSSAVYHDSAKNVQKPRTDANVQEQNTMNIKITEIPAAVKPSGSHNTGNEQDKGQKDNTASEQQIKEAITKANNKLRGHRTRCEFSYHEETKRVSIKVLDRDTEEVIREIPPEEALEMMERMWEIAGFLVDEKR